MSKTLEQKLCKRSFGYDFVRRFLVRPAMHLYYKKIDVIGVKAIPCSGPVIFAPNHQNALMDALVILCTKDRQPVFVARADIFKKPLIIAILNFLRILPIYRKRDGGVPSDNNQETFDLILKVLHENYAVGIMPEGTHNEIKRLRMLQKGIFRLAMQAQESHGSAPSIKIIPVGIEFSNTNKFRSEVIIRYGEAIEVSDFYEQYVENSARAFKLMQDALMKKMEEGMIHIANDQYYSEIEQLRVLYLKRALEKLGLDSRNAENRLQTQKKIIAVLHGYAQANPNEMSELCDATSKYSAILENHNLRDWVVRRQPYSLISMLLRSALAFLGLPFWMLGMLFNYLPYKLSALASRKIKDPQFVSSVQFVAGLVLYPLYHLIMIVLMAVFIPCVWGKFIMPLLIIPMGLFAYKYYLSMKKLIARFRFWSKKRRKDPEILEAVKLRKNIIEKMDSVFS